MNDAHLEPARSIITKIGIETVAEITGKHVSRVYRWMYSKERGGTGGFIPQSDAQLILQYARANGIALSAAEFLEPLLPTCAVISAGEAPEVARPAADPEASQAGVGTVCEAAE